MFLFPFKDRLSLAFSYLYCALLFTNCWTNLKWQSAATCAVYYKIRSIYAICPETKQI